MKKNETKKIDTKILQKINNHIDYYNNYKNDNVPEHCIDVARKEFFERIFECDDVIEINDKLNLISSNNKEKKLKTFDDIENLERVLEESKDAFSFLVYDKNYKPSIIVDIIGFIILTIIGIGFISTKQYVVGIILIICYVSLYLVTFAKDRKDTNKR